MMSTKLKVETFIAVLKKSGLVDRDRLEDALSDYFASGGGSEDPLPLVDRLIASNIVTKWQAEKLLQGKHRGYFLGKYKLLSLLGKGGMSSVYLAEHLLMRRRCALKVLPAKRVDDSSYLERFHREAQAVALLDHPNIVRAYDVDHQEDGDRQIHFLVMEHVDGLSLQEMVVAKGVLPILDAAEYTRQAAAGLQDAHEHGMVHRDIKPGNLLVDQNGVVKILDLGLARFFTAEEGDDALTIRHDEKVLGTADYLAPEQALDSHTVGARADIYSLGCTFYFMLSGQPPFTEGTLAQRLLAHQVKTPPAVESLRTDMPPGLVAIIRKMMEKRVDDRYATAGDLEKALFQWIDANADAQWRNAHSAVYGSRASQSEVLKKAVPVAQPVVARALNPLSASSSQLEAVTPNFPGSDLGQTPSPAQTTSPTQMPSPKSIETQETTMNQFFSTLTQSNSELKTPKTRSSSSIKTPPKSSHNQKIPDAPNLAATSPAATDNPSEYPVFDAHEFNKPAGPKPSDIVKSVASSTASLVTSHSERVKPLIARWMKLPTATRNGIVVGTGVLLILTLGMFASFDRDQQPTIIKQSQSTPFPLDKREATVGGRSADYANIRDALNEVRNRFRPGIGGSEKFVIRIAAGTYKERIRIDGRTTHWPEGVVLLGDGSVIIEPEGDEPVIRLSKVTRLTIENIQINAKEKPVAIEVTDDVDETRLKKLIVRGFSKIGVLCDGAQGFPFGNNQFVLEQLTFESPSPQATGIRLQDGNDIKVNSIVVRGCRFLGPMEAGIVVQSRDFFGLEVSESIFNKVTDGIRVDGQPTFKGVHFTNNTFRQSKYGIRFAKLPSEQSADLVIRRNLFTKTELAEVVVQDDYDESRFQSLLPNDPPGIQNNLSDRGKSAAPTTGEVHAIFLNGGRQDVSDFAFGSTDPKDSRFLAPTGNSPQKDASGAQPSDRKWVGAIGP